MTARWAAFLDRDGTLIEETGHLWRPEDVRIVPGAPEAVKRLNDAGALVVIVTNQPAVARGLLDEEALKELHKGLEAVFGDRGARFDAIYYCPHHPEKRPEGDPRFRIDCECRKPKPGMLKAAAERLGIDLAASYLVGDTTRDMLTAKNAGCRGVLVRTGYGGKDGLFNARPDAVCADVGAAADWILSQAVRA